MFGILLLLVLVLVIFFARLARGLRGRLVGLAVALLSHWTSDTPSLSSTFVMQALCLRAPSTFEKVLGSPLSGKHFLGNCCLCRLGFPIIQRSWDYRVGLRQMRRENWNGAK